MSDKPAGLHLPDLTIRNFRGIAFLSIKRLGRVTLLGGRNGVGKTTVLEAVRTYAARASQSTLQDLLSTREELVAQFDEDHGPVITPDYAALFHRRMPTREQPVRIGPNSGADDLRIEVSTPADWPLEQRDLFADLSTEAHVQAVKVVYRGQERLLPGLPIVIDPRAARSRRGYPRGFARSLFEEDWPAIDCESLGPGLPSNGRLARFWDRVALTEEEDLSLRALRLTDDGIERVAVVGDEESAPFRTIGRRVVVKVRDQAHPVPLKSLGDGATRLFAVALALANSRNGFLVIDEAENGIHYSVQRAFWRMILRTAQQYNVQVLATTHSSDCVYGFARAAIEFHDALGAYMRLDRDDDRVRAVEYTEEALATVAKQGIEVR